MANQLQAILKSNKIDVAVGIDKKRSASEIKAGIQSLINENKDLSLKLGVELSDNVKDINGKLKELQNKINDSSSINNAIKLDVTIDSSIKKLSQEIAQIQNKIQSSSSIKPIKLDVDIDIKGSALRIAGELGKIKKTITDFEQDYSTALKKVKASGDADLGGVLSSKKANEIKSNLTDIKSHMSNVFGDGEVSTKVIRDYRTNMETLSATIKKESGEIYTSLFKLKQNGDFELITETEVDKMQAQTNKAKRTMETLSQSVTKLQADLGNSKSFDLFDKLSNKQFVSEGEISKLKQLIMAEKELSATQQKRQAFTTALKTSMDSMNPAVSKVATEIKKLDVSLDGLNSSQLDNMIAKLKALNSQYKQDEATLRTRERLISSLADTQRKLSQVSTTSLGSNNSDEIARLRATLKVAEANKYENQTIGELTNSLKILSSVRTRLNEIQQHSASFKNNQAMEQEVARVQKLIKALKDVGKASDSDVSRYTQSLTDASNQSITAVKMLGKGMALELDRAKNEQKELIRNFDLIKANVSDSRLQNIQGGIFKALNGGTIDTTALKRYFGELKQGEVSTVAVTEKTNQFGQAVNEVKIKMAGTGKTVEAYTFQMNKSNTATQMAVKETGKAIVDNENKALGFREQLEIAMKRVPSYILSMQGIYAVVNGFKAVSNEIMEINKQMIEIQRVAGAGINVDNLLTGAIGQAKELGNNVHDILDALGEYSRTFDDLTEQQLLTVTKTAVVMSNVSDLNLSESVSSLVGTMNAFNISAGESLHIVDALNEVDNNYSISTKQLAESLSKAGATAQTFGVSMEEVAGQTTAIGAVTQESGAIIGNSLKTIYSRITTMKPSQEILESVGVSIRKVGEHGQEMKGVTEIMGELAGKWGDLSAEQQQNIGVTIAGRNQLSRFLAVMNNWDMAVEATNSAINSTNSAMNEQGVHMQSFEARLNALKTRFTELSLAIGGAFLSDGMMLGIDALGKLGDIAVSTTNKFGALPVMFGSVTAVIASFNKVGKGFRSELVGIAQESVMANNKLLSFSEGLGGVAKRLSETFGITRIFESYDGTFRNTVKNMNEARTSAVGLGKAQGVLGTAFTATTATVKASGSAMLAFMSSTAGVTLGLTAVVAAIGFVTEKMIKAKQERTELEKQYNSNLDKSVEQFNRYGNNFDTLISKYEQLKKAKDNNSLDTKQEEEYNKTVKELADILPNAIAYTDANGEAHLKATEAIRKEAEATAKLNAEKLKENDKKFDVDISNNAKDYDKQIAKVKELKAQIKELNAYVKGGIDEGGKNSRESALKDLEVSNIQTKLSKTLSDNATKISENTQAWMQSEGTMKNVSEAGKGIIDTFAKVNQYSVDSKEVTDDYAGSQEKLQAKTREFGKAIAESYEQLSHIGGAGGEKAIALFDKLGSSMDDSVMKSDGASNKIRALSKAIQEMATNSNDFVPEDFIARLEELGFTENEAKKATMDLGTELQNQKIKAQIASDEMTSYSDAIVDMTNATYEAIDGQKKLLGLQDGEYEDISSKLSYISSIKKINSELFNSSAEVQAYIAEISAKTGIASSQIQDKTVEIFEAYQVMGSKTEQELAEMANMPADKLREANKGMSDQGFALLQSMLGYVKSGVFDINAQLILALKGNREQVEQHTEELKASFEKLQKAPNDVNVENAFFNGLQNNLNQLQDQFVITTDKTGKFVREFKTIDGTKSAYFDELNRQLQLYGDKLQIVKDESTGALSVAYKDAEGNLRTLYNLQSGVDGVSGSIDKAQVATGFLVDNFNKLQQAPQDSNALQTWLNGISSQYQSIGSDIEVVTDKQGRLEFALDKDGTKNPWLIALNNQIKQLGGEIVKTGNEVDGFTYKVNIGGQEYELFKTVGQQADGAKAKVDGAKDSTDKLHNSAGKTTTGKVEVDSSSVDTAQQKTDQLGQSDGKVVTVKAEGNTIGLNPLEKTISDLQQKSLTGFTFKATVEPINVKTLQEADGTIQTTQKRIETLIGNITVVKNGVNETVNILDFKLTSRNSSLETIAENLNKIRENAVKASSQIDELSKKARDINFTVKGNFDLPKDFGSQVDNLINNLNKLKSQTDSIMGGIKSSMSTNLKIGHVDTSALNTLQAEVSQKMAGVSATISNFGVVVASAIAKANQAMVFDASSLIVYRNTSVQTVSALTGIWNNVRTTLPNMIQSTTSSMLNIWNNGTKAMADRNAWLRNQTVSTFNGMNGSVVNIIANMSSRMQATFRSGTSGLYQIASGIPAQIGKGISDNMNSATGSLQTLADNMVSRFKSALGIHSPSRVFEELGGYVIAGLTNGLTGGNLKELGKTVFKDFGGGVFDTMDMIKAYVSGDFSAMAGDVGGAVGVAGAGVQQWAGVATKALMMTNQYSPANLQALLYQMQTESGGNPRAINNWDINAINGTPSKGLMQVIDPTFRAYAMPGFGNIYNPLDNILASIRYAVSRYGSLANAYRGHGYANGGFVDTPELAWHGEEGEEAIIPLIPKRRKRGIELWMETTRKLGLGNLIGLKGSNGVGGVSTGFGASEGESGSSAGGEGGAGVNVPAITATIESLSPVFNESAKPSLDALYKRDTAGLKIDQTQTKIDKSEAVLKRLIQNTVAYRNQLLGIQNLNKTLLSQQKAQYDALIKRQNAINAELGKLKNTSKHTEAQRKRYNELQQEYDTNSNNLWKLETQIENLNNEIRQSDIDIYLDYIAEIGNRWDTTIESVKNAQDKLSFDLQKLEYTNPNDVGAQLKIQYDMIEQQQKLELTYKNQVAKYQAEYNSIVSKKGANSEQAQAMKKMLDEAKKNYDDAVLGTLKTQKEVKDAREKIAQDEINSLKNYYKQMQSMSKQATDKELDNLKKAHDAKMKSYDDEIQKINEVYDATLKAYEEKKSEEEYEKKMSDYNQQRVDLMQKISMASRDNSLEGKKALADLQKQLTDLNKEITDAQADRQETLWKDQLEKQKQEQIDEQNKNKDDETEKFDNQTDEINKKADEINDYYDKLINDETAWQNAIDKWNAGDTDVLTQMMNDMKDELANLMGGKGNGILGTDGLSEEDIKAIVGDNLTDVSNIWLSIKDQLEELNSINKNLDDLNSKQQQGNNAGAPSYTTGATSSGVGHNNVAPILPKDPPKPAPSKPKPNNGIKATHVVVSGDTLWDLAKRYYGDYYQWTKIQKANGGIDPYRVPIGKKLLIPFDTGGYTGDWNGEQGRVAMLHKKELVLNKDQTKDILNTVSVVTKAKKQADTLLNNISKSGDVNSSHVGDINMYFPNYKGDQGGANLVADTLIKKLKSKR